MSEGSLVYLARTPGPRASFVARVREELFPLASAIDAARVAVAMTVRENPRLTVLPLREENLVMLAVDGASERACEPSVEALRRLGSEVFGYRVETSYPLRYERTWSVSERSPGEILLTLLVPRSGLPHDAFMHEWHGVHTPKALRIHPMWSYRRDVVLAPAIEGSPAFAGIVTEHYRSLDDILNPVRMFGGGVGFAARMLEVARHVKGFLDLRRTQNFLAQEWVLRDTGSDA